jgi:hypothetical protein
MNLTYTKKDLLILALTTPLFIIGLLFYFLNYINLFSIVITILNAIFIIKFIKKIPILLLFIFIFFYTRTFNYYFVDSITISYWSDFQTFDVLKRVLLSHALFIFFLGNSINTLNQKYSFDFRNYFRPNKILFYFFLIISILTLIFGIRGESLLNGATYASQESTSKSTLHEYFILFFFFLIVFSSDVKFERYIIFIMLILYILKTILYGGRIEVVEIGLLWFYLFYYYLNKVQIRTVLFILLFGIYISNVINNIRTNPTDFITGIDTFSFFDPTSSIASKSKYEILSTNEGDVIQSSARIVGLIDRNELSLQQRIISGGLYLFSPLLPASILPEFANLSVYKQDLYKSGGGALISTYFFSWLNYMGPILISLILAFIINQFYSNNSIYNYVYCSIMFVMFPRWFAYNPIMLVKFCFYAIIIIFLIIKIYKYKIQIPQLQIQDRFEK